MTLVPQDAPFTIPAGGQAFQMTVVTPPKMTTAGRYTLTYRVEGKEEASEVSVALEVSQVRELDCQIISYPKNVFKGECYPIVVFLKNLGNGIEEIELSANCPATFQCPRVVTLQPQEMKEVVIDIQAPDQGKSTCHFTVITCNTLNKESVCSKQATCITHLYPKCTDKFSPYTTIPSVFSIGASTWQKRFEAYLELEGEGYLDEAKSKHVSYYVCTETFQDCDFFRNINYVPEAAYVTYKDKQKQIYLGQGPFFLTPLTMRSAYGVGSFLRLYSQRFQGGVVFLNSISCNEELLGGGYISCKLFPWWNLSTQVFKSWDGKMSRVGYDCNNAFINSISTEMRGANHTLCAEFGKNWEENKQAYCFSAQGAWRGISYGIANEYCPKGYQYCCNGSDALNMTTNFPIGKGFRGNVSYWGVRNYLDWNFSDRYRENKVFTAMLTCPPRIWLTNFTYQHQVLNDYCSNFCNVTDTGTVGACGFIRCVHYFVGASLGKWKNSACCDSSPFWHQYNGSLSCCFRKCWQGTFNISVGPAIGYCFSNLTKRTGFRLSWRGNQRLRFEAGLNRWWFNGCHGQTCGDLRTSYSFCNGHTFELDAVVKWMPGCSNYLYFTTFNYSIPWNLISGRKCSKSALKGHLVDEAGTPLAYQRVDCGSHKTLTDKQGMFAFPNIDPGEHSLFINPDAKGHVLANKDSLSQVLKGGYEKTVSFVMVRSCSIRGKVSLFGFEELGETAEEKALSTKGFKLGAKCKELKPIGGVAVYIQSKTRKETHRQLTNQSGEFSFTQLPPGDWYIEVEYEAIPPYHELTLSEDVVTLFPGETHEVMINVVPKPRKIQML